MKVLALPLTLAVGWVLVASPARLAAEIEAPKHVIVEARGARSWLFESKLEQTVDAGLSSAIDFTQDLELKHDWSPQLLAIWKITNGHRVRVEWTRFVYVGDTRLARDITIGDITIPVDAFNRTEIESQRLSVSYSYLFKLGTERFRLGPMIEVRRFSDDIQFDGWINEPVEENWTAKTGVEAWGGSIGGELDAYLAPQVNLNAFVTYIAFGKLDGYFHIDTTLRYFFRRWIGVTAGYIYDGGKIKNDDPQGFLRIQTHQVFVGLAFGF